MMLQKNKIALLLAALLFVGSCAVQIHAVTIAKNGLAQAVIVVAQDAPESEQHAAAELADFLRQITGAKFEIVQVATAATANKPRLLVGQKAAVLSRASKPSSPDWLTDGLGAEGIVIRTVGNDLILAGGYPRGTLYAVYTFLEDELGCRWWSSKVSTIPKKQTLKVGKLNIRYVPVLEYREAYWADARDGDWAVRNKCNGHAAGLDAKRGGKHIYQGFVHTFYSLIPPGKYFNDHPEWFSEIDGERVHRHQYMGDRPAQLCLTNEQMRKELVKNLKERLCKNPAATIASVSQNDAWGNCQCSRCAAVDKEEGSPAGSLLRFVNAVAADIEEEFPHVAVSTLSYLYTRKPPKYVKPRHNVIVRLCTIECSFSRPLAHEQNKEFRDDITGWSKICNRLYVWDYVTNFKHHIMPHPNLRVLGPNVKFFVEHNVKGIFEQGASATKGAEMAELRAWVLAKLLWDPALDAQKLIEEFVNGYYGPAAEHILAYLKVTHDAVEKSSDWLGCSAPYNSQEGDWFSPEHTTTFFSFDMLNKGWAHLKAAEQAVKDNPELHFRVQVVQLPVMYVLIMRWNEMREKAQTAGVDWPMPDSIQEAFDHFVKIAKKKNITRLSEQGKGYDALEEALKRAGK